MSLARGAGLLGTRRLPAFRHKRTTRGPFTRQPGRRPALAPRHRHLTSYARRSGRLRDAAIEAFVEDAALCVRRSVEDECVASNHWRRYLHRLESALALAL